MAGTPYPMCAQLFLCQSLAESDQDSTPGLSWSSQCGTRDIRVSVSDKQVPVCPTCYRSSGSLPLKDPAFRYRSGCC